MKWSENKKLLIVCLLCILCSCTSTYTVRKATYNKELSEKKINKSEYNYLMQGNKELNKMKCNE